MSLRWIAWIVSALRFALPIGLGWLIAQAVAGAAAFATIALNAGLAPLLGVILLRASTPSRITWKNYLAGYLVPWGYRLSQGKLWIIALISGVGWLLLQLVGYAFVNWPTSAPQAVASAPGVWPRVALVGGWLVYGGLLLYLLGLLREGLQARAAYASVAAKLVALVLLLLLSSVLLALNDALLLAAWISAGPPIALGSCFLLWVAVLLGTSRNRRWN